MYRTHGWMNGWSGNGYWMGSIISVLVIVLLVVLFIRASPPLTPSDDWSGGACP